MLDEAVIRGSGVMYILYRHTNITFNIQRCSVVIFVIQNINQMLQYIKPIELHVEKRLYPRYEDVHYN